MPDKFVGRKIGCKIESVGEQQSGIGIETSDQNNGSDFMPLIHGLRTRRFCYDRAIGRRLYITLYLQDCIPALIDFAVSDQSPEDVQLSTLQALTNLSLSASYHGPYTCLIQQLYQHLDRDSAALQCQAMKVLMNLSTNADMVPNLLAAKVGYCLLVYIQGSYWLFKYLKVLHIHHIYRVGLAQSGACPPLAR